MSKSYGNTIPLFLEGKALQKKVNQIVTNSQSPAEPKDADVSAVFTLHRLLLGEREEQVVREKYRAGGMGWGQAKKDLAEALDEHLRGPRNEYFKLMADKGHIDEILRKGGQRARSEAAPFLENIRRAVGIR